MTQRQPPLPQRRVRYQMRNDALGNYITFTLADVLVLPDDIPPNRLPEGAQLKFELLHCRFSGASRLDAHELRQLFLEFAWAMDWEAQLDP